MSEHVRKLINLAGNPELKAIATTFFLRVGSAFFAYAVQILLARLLGPSEFGVFTSLLTWVMVISCIGSLGFTESSIRLTPKYVTRRRFSAARNFFLTSIISILAFGLLILALASGLVLVLSGYIADELLILLLVLALANLVISIEECQECICRGYSWFAMAVAPSYLLRPILTGVTVAFIFWYGFVIDGLHTFLIMMAISGALCLVQFFLIGWRSPHDQKKQPLSKRKLKFWLTISLPLILVSVVENAFLFSDILILSFIAEKEEVALYFAAVRSMALVTFVYYSFMLVSPIKFSLDNAGQDPEQLQKSVSQTSKWSFLLTIPAVLITLGAGYPLLHLFGTDYITAYPVMWIVAIGFIARSVVGPAADLFIVLGHQKASVIICAISLALNISVSLILYPVWGISGVAAATALSLTVRSSLMAIYLKRSANLDITALSALRNPNHDAKS